MKKVGIEGIRRDARDPRGGRGIILSGGGVALLRASEHLKGIRTKKPDQKTEVEIVRKALSYPEPARS